ncbi:endonuclease/exonuclease/phosphatase family protein [Paenibacillus brevis]|uniref:Endonuclease/exonuclease/phosphatase family protein n=1 Tax=Paenibacillus brevis TaxID=2841508 RepID=A0ABS6FKJ9_9BACL|nr:endonuclease/exonuclease/phosphatase family protein [Paenibacillus brevis]MBU5670703.1 endonuclease/exonuclease/phosphatase family protein [Paenibacillus brevis]
METEQTETTSQQIKMMTFNIRNRTGTGDIAWVNRRSLVIRAIESFEPDLLGMQEGYANQIQDILDGLRAPYKTVGLSRFGNAEDEYNNILYRSDKFQAAKWGQFWLSNTPDLPGSFSEHESKYPRICTWAKFESIQPAGAPLYYFNTHLGLTEEARAQGVNILLERMERHVDCSQASVFLGGDFNMEETSPLFRQIELAGFQDTWAALGHSYTNDGTYNNFENTRNLEHIDWIFQRNCTVLSSIEINGYHENGRCPSDHFPVQLVAEIPYLPGS